MRRVLSENNAIFALGLVVCSIALILGGCGLIKRPATVFVPTERDSVVIIDTSYNIHEDTCYYTVIDSFATGGQIVLKDTVMLVKTRTIAKQITVTKKIPYKIEVEKEKIIKVKYVPAWVYVVLIIFGIFAIGGLILVWKL